MMSLAAAVGIDVPAIRLVHRDELDGLPDNLWPRHEEWAYAIRRFDRNQERGRIHIEDLAQVRNVYPDRKYEGNFETIAAIVHRGRDVDALREFTRRLVFIILISNGDGHLKNWSLIYRDPRVPTLAPAYDLVATAPFKSHADGPEDLGLKLAGSRRFSTVSVATFAHLQRRLDVETAELPDVVAQCVADVERQWPEYAERFDAHPWIRDQVSESIQAHSGSLMRRVGVS